MPDIYKARWEAAKKLVSDFKDKCKAQNAEFFMFDNEREMISIDQLIIGESEIFIEVIDESKKSRFRYQLFENNKECNHGLHNSIKDFRDEFITTVKAYKQVKIT